MLSKTFRLKIAAIVVTISLLIICFGIFSGLSFTQLKMEEATLMDLNAVATIADSLITTEINLLKSSTETIARRASAARSKSELRLILERQLVNDLYHEFLGFAIFDEKGFVTGTGRYPAVNEWLNMECIQKAFLGESVISTIRKYPTDEKLVMNVCVPMDGSRVFVVTVDGLIFYDLLKDITVWKSGYVMINDKDGYNIATNDIERVKNCVNFPEFVKDNFEYSGVEEILEKMLAGESGSAEYEHNGRNKIVYRPITGSKVGWSLGVSVPMKESPMINVRIGFLFVGLICFMFCIFAAYIVSGSVQKYLYAKALQKETNAANQAKNVFLTNMSHEMRTPLNAIVGLTELTLGEDNIADETRETLEQVYNSSMTLLGLINDILDLSKIEAGRFEIVPVEYDLPSVICDTIALNRVRIGSKPIEFIINADENLPMQLYGDDLRVRQVFNNLLSNAFKYTKQGTVTWTINSERYGDTVVVRSHIQDTGIGIKAEDIDKLFGEFNQLDTRFNRGTQGTGLGLAITKRLIELLDGNITVESEYGKGSTFHLSFCQKYVTDEKIGAEIAQRLCNSNFKSKHDRSKKLIRNQMPYARVLVVDDVSTNLDVGRGMLKPYGMTVDCVMSGPEAIERVRMESPVYDAIFMDHMMPGMDGIEATRIIREEIGTAYAQNVPIIALTANAIIGNEEIFLKNGFQAFLSKPIDIMRLDSELNKWVRDRDKEDSLAADNAENTSFITGFAPPRTPVRTLGQADASTDYDSNDSKPVNTTITINIPGINAGEAIARFADDANIWLSVVRSYAENTPSLIDQIRGFDQDMIDDYAIIVHGIKGSSRSIGAEDIGFKAEALEHAAKGGHIAFIEQNNSIFVEETQTLLNEINTVLHKIYGDKPTRKAPSLVMLENLRSAAEIYDIDGVENALCELESYKYETNGDLVVWLREQITLMGFENIVQRLAM